MTLYELSMEYERTAALLWGRISELERIRRGTADEQEAHQIEGRLRPLRSMYRETRAVARHLGRYYQKYVPRRSAGSGIPIDHRRRRR